MCANALALLCIMVHYASGVMLTGKHFQANVQ